MPLRDIQNVFPSIGDFCASDNILEHFSPASATASLPGRPDPENAVAGGCL